MRCRRPRGCAVTFPADAGRDLTPEPEPASASALRWRAIWTGRAGRSTPSPASVEGLAWLLLDRLPAETMPYAAAGIDLRCRGICFRLYGWDFPAQTRPPLRGAIGRGGAATRPVRDARSRKVG